MDRLKRYIGEVTFEVCEGMENGIEDFRQASLASMQAVCTRYMGGDPTMSGFFTQMYGNTFLNLIQGCYEYHVNEGQNRVPAHVDNRQIEIDGLINEINGLQVPASQPNQPQSEAYKKGSINRK